MQLPCLRIVVSAFMIVSFGVASHAQQGRPGIGGIRILDYSESGHAFQIRSGRSGEFEVHVLPGHDPHDLDIAVRGKVGHELQLNVYGAPAEATPVWTSGKFEWHPIHRVDRFPDHVRIRLRIPSPHVVIRLGSIEEAPLARGARAYYDLARLETFLATLGGDPRVTVEVLGWSYLNRPGIDRPIYKVTVSDSAYPDIDKLAILVTSRVHGNEAANSFITEGMIEFARGAMPNPPATRPDDLLERMMFIFYVMVNPDGVEAVSRYNTNGIDLNRDWDETGSGPTEEWEVRHVHGDIENFLVTYDFALAADMHGWSQGYEGGFRFAPATLPGNVPANYFENQQTYFEVQAEVNPWRPVANFFQNGATVGMARYCLFTQYGIDVHTSETNENSLRSEQSLIEEGSNYVMSFHAYLLNAAFTDDVGADVADFASCSDPVYITVLDADENHDPAVVEQIDVLITDSTTGDQETVILVEIGVDAGVFRNPIGIPIMIDSLAQSDGRIQTVIGNTLQARYTDPNFPQSTTTVRALMIAIPGDSNLDGSVNVLDLLDLLADWGSVSKSPSDFNHDGVIDVLDLLSLLAAWGDC